MPAQFGPDIEKGFAIELEGFVYRVELQAITRTELRCIQDKRAQTLQNIFLQNPIVHLGIFG